MTLIVPAADAKSATNESMTFANLGLSETLLQALTTEGYTIPTPIQTLAIPHVLAGKDVLGWAQTGTGKTAAFALPVLQRLGNVAKIRPNGVRIKCLVLAPTRELAHQIAESFGAYGRHTGLRHAVVFGGVGMNPQIDALRRGIDILIATPGRLLDLMNQGFVNLNYLEVLILDEADRMLDMGFIHDIKRVIKAVPEKKQTLLFSATMAPEIMSLAKGLLKNPVTVEVAPLSSAAETVTQSLYYVEKKEKQLLLHHLIEAQKIKRTIIFTRTKHVANKVAEALNKHGVGSEAFHSNKSQNARLRALQSFKSGQISALVATDIAARGIDIDEITHVINFDLPNEPESYIHRIGRTGRAGASGLAISFCAADEREFLPGIERLLRKKIPVEAGHPYVSTAPTPRVSESSQSRPRPQGRPSFGSGIKIQGKQSDNRSRRPQGR